mmetsp:Transcript_3715/g.9553  ORF Transcript_3715/g.9553 Transcript_3715/m.9553 type:complete len:454 (-) Transcript_3715:42-1403(-)
MPVMRGQVDPRDAALQTAISSVESLRGDKNRLDRLLVVVAKALGEAEKEEEEMKAARQVASQVASDVAAEQAVRVAEREKFERIQQALEAERQRSMGAIEVWKPQSYEPILSSIQQWKEWQVTALRIAREGCDVSALGVFAFSDKGNLMSFACNYVAEYANIIVEDTKQDPELQAQLRAVGPPWSECQHLVVKGCSYEDVTFYGVGVGSNIQTRRRASKLALAAGVFLERIGGPSASVNSSASAWDQLVWAACEALQSPPLVLKSASSLQELEVQELPRVQPTSPQELSVQELPRAEPPFPPEEFSAQELPRAKLSSPPRVLNAQELPRARPSSPRRALNAQKMPRAKSSSSPRVHKSRDTSGFTQPAPPMTIPEIRLTQATAIGAYAAEAEGYLSLEAGDRLRVNFSTVEPGAEGDRYNHYVYGWKQRGNALEPISADDCGWFPDSLVKIGR